jgi:ATP-dependent phosphoenolpyruvate carboxykinase
MWADREAYDRTAHELALRFRTNFERFGEMATDITEAGPAV